MLWLFKSLSLALLCFPVGHEASVFGYRVGDVVDTVIVTDGNQRSSPFRHQMPIFGANWIPYIRFEKSNLIGSGSNENNDEVHAFSLQFEDGYWVLPTISLTKQNGGQNPTFLDHLTVQFVFYKAGSGAIHAVSTKDATYSTDHKSFFHVTYEWIEEEAVSPSVGLAFMFLFVFLSSVFSMLISCGIIVSDQDSESTSKIFESNTHGHSLSVPKCD
jgi:hypothetical protein